MGREDLVSMAQQVSENAVAHHSHFHVGAALETASGKVYTGCNVESDSYGLTICAERVALTKALSEGEREFSRIAIIGIQHDGEGNPVFGKEALAEATARGNSWSTQVNSTSWGDESAGVQKGESGQQGASAQKGAGEEQGAGDQLDSGAQEGSGDQQGAGRALGPCGACRQLLWDHCRDIEVIGATPTGEIGKVWRLADLLPDAFNFNN